MNSRERFLSTMAFEPTDRALLWEMGYWAATLRRWYGEGLPKVHGIPDDFPDGEAVRGPFLGFKQGAVDDRDAQEAAHLDRGFVRIPLNNYFFPAFPRQVIEDHGTWVLERDEKGVLLKKKVGMDSLPNFVRGPVTTLRDFEELAEERLRPGLEGRLPAGWLEEVIKQRDAGSPVVVAGSHGFFGTPRYLLGVEQLLLTYRQDPGLIQAINARLANFWCALYDQVLNQVKADMAFIWEDMSYKAGPLISPAMFEQCMLPYYKQLTGLFRDHGIRTIFVDTDGDCRKLIPCFVKGGVTGLFPFEVTNGQDIRDVAEAFPRLQIGGGLDKKALAKGPAAIDAELEAKVPPLVRRGGYMPFVDHHVPPDVSWHNFLYYRQRMAELVWVKP
jgi:hypothetical protein